MILIMITIVIMKIMIIIITIIIVITTILVKTNIVIFTGKKSCSSKIIHSNVVAADKINDSDIIFRSKKSINYNTNNNNNEINNNSKNCTNGSPSLPTSKKLHSHFETAW